MKKSIKAELVSLAHRILKLKEDASYEKMTEEARAVYEKLTILAYAEQLEKSGQPTIGIATIENSIESLLSTNKDNLEIPKDTHDNLEADITEEAQKNEIPLEVTNTPISKTPSVIAAENEARYKEARSNDRHRPDGTVFNSEEPVHEPVIEKIKDMVAEMPPEAAVIDEIIDSIEPQDRYQKNDMLEIGGEYAQIPIFEPVVTAEEDEKPQSLNDKLKTGLKIGLNDKIAFIKHLFNGSDTDYNRVLSQLSTFSSVDEAKGFINQIVKPDYNQWEGKEVYEERFLQVIDNKFN